MRMKPGREYLRNTPTYLVPEHMGGKQVRQVGRAGEPFSKSPRLGSIGGRWRERDIGGTRIESASNRVVVGARQIGRHLALGMLPQPLVREVGGGCEDSDTRCELRVRLVSGTHLSTLNPSF
jgi:hypothetical protein